MNRNGNPPLIPTVMAGIVGVGVAGTLWSLRTAEILRYL